MLDQYAWHAKNSEQTQHLPRVKRPNLRGIFDMHGNVQEWCHDWLGRVHAYEDPSGPVSNSDRVNRGGSFIHGGSNLRAAARPCLNPADRGRYLGFRIAMTLADE